MEDNNFNLVNMGTKSRPLPTWNRTEHKGGALMSAKGQISLYTQRSDMDNIDIGERLYAELMRNYPSRNMIENLIHELKARDPNRTDWKKNSFVSGNVGGPGVGKSFLFKLIGDLVHPQGALYLNCKGTDMGSIFSETVFDTSGAMEEKSAIDARIIQHNQGINFLKPDSINTLKSALGDIVKAKEIDGKEVISIDWGNLKVSGSTSTEQEYQAQVVSQCLRQICSNEDIAIKEGGLSIGITTRDGIAIRALDKNSADYGRPILLDELNADEDGEGSQEKLFEFIAFLSDPKVKTITLTGGQNRQITINRDDIPSTFRFNFTANPNAEGMNRGGFDRALMSRFGAQLDIRTVPDSDELDYADRIAGYLTGAPLMQIYATGRQNNGQNIFDDKPEILVAAANNIREKALTPSEKKHLNDSNGREEAQNIEIAGRVIKMSTQLASFFDRLGDLLNPESNLYQSSDIDISTEYGNYLNEVQVDARLVTKLIEKASSIAPIAETENLEDIANAFAGGFAEKDNPIEAKLEDSLGNRGKRLEDFILEWLKEVIIPADAKTRGIDVKECNIILNLALKEAADNGIGSRDHQDGFRGQVTPIHKLFNIDRFKNIREQMRIVRDVMLNNLKVKLDSLRNDDPSVPELPENKDEIVSISEWENFSDKALELANEDKELLSVCHPDLEHMAENPFGQGYLLDTINLTKNPDIEFKDLIERDGLLSTLATPKFKEITLSRIWEQIVTNNSETTDSDSIEEMLTVTSLLVQKNGNPDIMHIIRDEDNTILVSGPNNDDDFKELLKRQNITYIDYTDSSAAELLDTALDESCKGDIDELKSSFLMRNGLEEDREKYMDMSIGELITDVKNIPPIAPVYVTSKPNHSLCKKLLYPGAK